MGGHGTLDDVLRQLSFVPLPLSCSTLRGEPLHPFLPISYVEARVSPKFMLRLVNVEEALGLLQRMSEAPLVLEAEDDEITENAGPYTVGGSDGDVARGAQAQDRMMLDVC